MESELRKKIQAEIEPLQTVRDELRVQIHLGAVEAREAWEKAETSWQHLESRAKVLGEATKESLEEVGEAVGILADEIRTAYQHIRNLL